MSDFKIKLPSWRRMEQDIAKNGYAVSAPRLSDQQCDELISLYGDDRQLRSRVTMAEHHFGEGDYAYFADPLPPLVSALREAYYAELRRLPTA